MLSSQLIRSLLIGLLLGAAGFCADLMSRHLNVVADARHPDFREITPPQFSSWKRMALPGNAQIAQAGLYEYVSESRYVLPDGGSVMLSIAYGANQLNERFQMHRPEYCYKAQGFDIIETADGNMQALGRELPVRRLLAVNKNRIEHVTYWMTISGRVALPGWRRKLVQFDSGLHGEMPDGYLVRVSTVGDESASAQALQQKFLKEWLAALPAAIQPSLIGPPG